MGIKNFLEMLQFKEEEYDDYMNEDFDDNKNSSRNNYNEENIDDNDNQTSYDEEYKNTNPTHRIESEQRKVRPVKMDRAVNNKVVPIKSTNRNLEVCIMKPTSFADSQDICDMLISGRAAVVNLEGFDPIEAQRIMDFISGCVYAISGRLHQISRYIFIFSPDTIDISGDYLDLLPGDGFGVPTINKEF